MGILNFQKKQENFKKQEKINKQSKNRNKKKKEMVYITACNANG